jgi:GTPase SAR1 family protein
MFRRNKKEYFIEFLDVGGRCKHKDTRNPFYLQVNGIILVYDLTNKKSLLNLWQWIAELPQHKLYSHNPQESLGMENNGIIGNPSNSGGLSPIIEVGTKRRLTNSTENVSIKISGAQKSSMRKISKGLSSSNIQSPPVFIPLLVVGTKKDLISINQPGLDNHCDISDEYNGTHLLLSTNQFYGTNDDIKNQFVQFYDNCIEKKFFPSLVSTNQQHQQQQQQLHPNNFHGLSPQSSLSSITGEY